MTDCRVYGRRALRRAHAVRIKQRVHNYYGGRVRHDPHVAGKAASVSHAVFVLDVRESAPI
jgi:hypothetical protein